MGRNCTIIEIIRQMVVSTNSLLMLRGIVPAEQHEELKPGDVITLLLFYNGFKKWHGTVTVWHNRSRAAIKSPEISRSGEWDEARGILVTDDRENGWSTHGEEISGRIAFDLFGYDGILCSGRFFRGSLTRQVPSVSGGR